MYFRSQHRSATDDSEEGKGKLDLRCGPSSPFKLSLRLCAQSHSLLVASPRRLARREELPARLDVHELDTLEPARGLLLLSLLPVRILLDEIVRDFESVEVEVANEGLKAFVSVRRLIESDIDNGLLVRRPVTTAIGFESG
jgi:hypothetical protein